MCIKEFEVPLGYGILKGQMFGDIKINSIIILAVHGFMDNSNRFELLALLFVKTNEFFL
jgi:hypothetical protein